MSTYGHVLDNYRVFFEGLPEPVFYLHFYPMGDKSGEYGQELWSEFNYGRGLKRDKDKDGNRLREFQDEYEQDLRGLLNAVMADSKGKSRGVVVIPSSTKGEINRVTELTRKVLASNPRAFADLTYSVTRVKDKKKAHAGGGRSYDENFDTLGVSPEIGIDRFDIILVLDDVLTTGTSFRAMDDRLRDAGFTGTIVNFAFSHTFPSEGAIYCWNAERSVAKMPRHMKLGGLPNDEMPVEGIVFDLDQTLLDDGLRENWFEGILGSPNSQGCKTPYETYEGVKDLIGQLLPFAIVSNRSERQLARLLRMTSVREDIYPCYGDIPYAEGDERYRIQHRSQEYLSYGPGTWATPSMPRNVFSFPTEDNNGYTIRLYKPSPRGVNNALAYLRREFLGNRPNARIIGLGNTYEDMVAYNAAGIESTLALWGVPNNLKDHARLRWGADHAFETVADLLDWINSFSRYYEMGLAASKTNPLKAREYFELAIKHGDNVGDSAFELACMLRESSPTRAAQLYETAIAAGNISKAANDLGVLILNDDPERAVALFETAIEAGNERTATRNLALTIWRSDSKLAVALFERAARAGNSSQLAKDLEPLITDGCEEAVKLYERLIVAQDGKRANDLANIIKTRNPKCAMRLYEQAIDAGDELYATYNLGVMIMDDQPERAERLFERALAAGDVSGGANALGFMLVEKNAARARSLFEQAMSAGDKKYAPVNLSRMICNDEPERAFELLSIAVRNGRMDVGADILFFAGNNMPEAIDLYEQTMVAKDETLANALAVNIRLFAPERARSLYERAIAAGDEYYATNNLGALVMEEDPDLARTLFERAIAAGDEKYATNNLGVLVAKYDRRRAIDLFERAHNAGDCVSAPCNLAHLLIASEPKQAEALYEESASHGEVEAMIGLAYLLRDKDVGQASELLSKALQADNRDKAVDFLLEFISHANRATAIDVARYLTKNNFDIADDMILRLSLGEIYDSSSGTVQLGTSSIDGKPLIWTVVDHDSDYALFLCARTVATMAYCDDGLSATWETSVIRRWLNTEFIDEWLGEATTTKLVPHHVTNDLVFCLSSSEIESLNASGEHLLACRERTADRNAEWWVRADEGTTMSAPYITANSELKWKLAFLTSGVRPALKVSLNHNYWCPYPLVK